MIGAGIAGLTAALCLAKAGIPVDVFERAPRLEDAGAGLQLSPNALRVLAGLGLMERLTVSAVAARTVTLRSGASGRVLAEVPVGAGDGTPYLSILRADLQSVLLAAVHAEPRIALQLDATLSAIRPSSTAGRLDLDVTPRAGAPILLRNRPLVLAADGVRSAVAAALGLGAPVRTGLAAWRMMAAAGDGAPAGVEAWLGRGHHAVAYPVAGGRTVNLVLIGPDRPARSGDGERDDLLRRFRGWDRRLRDTIAGAGPVGVWPLLTADRMDAAVPEGLFLLGDAGHAMLPFAAQGAAMAIEDAAVAAHALATAPTIADARAAFLAERRGRIARVRRRAAFHRVVYHLPWPLTLGRDAALALRPADALRRDLAWLYEWRAPTI